MSASFPSRRGSRGEGRGEIYSVDFKNQLVKSPPPPLPFILARGFFVPRANECIVEDGDTASVLELRVCCTSGDKRIVGASLFATVLRTIVSSDRGSGARTLAIRRASPVKIGLTTNRRRVSNSAGSEKSPFVL